MSWTDVYPVFTDDQVERYLNEVTPEEKIVHDSWFAVKRVIQPQMGEHLVATSLFWKNLTTTEKELPVLTRESMIRADELELISRYAPWDHYVQPLLDGAVLLKKARPEVVFRVYLAADLEFLVSDLVEVGCEVMLMESSSISHNPGAMWRFLALEESDRWVTITDSDRARDVMHDVERTEHAISANLGAWRAPYVFDRGDHEYDAGFYRPINACHFGGRGGPPLEMLMKAFIWHSVHDLMPRSCQLPGGRQQSIIAGTKWPDYAYDEWFLLSAIYPRFAFDGFLTFISGKNPRLTCWHGLDLEYVTWANPNSELFICEDIKDNTPWPWNDWKDNKALKTLPDSAVICRERRRLGPAHRILSEPPSASIASFHKFHGDFLGLLEWAVREVKESWWIDLNPRLKLSHKGGELFTSRYCQYADVVVCGSFFIRITPLISKWADRMGLTADLWSEGSLLKLPKLEGPMTLWKTEFSHKFHDELITQGAPIRPEILLRAWMDQGKVRTVEASARPMGWDVR